MNDKPNERMFEVLLERAVCEDFDRQIDAYTNLPSPEYDFSVSYNKRIRAIFKSYRRQSAAPRRRTAKRVAVIVLAAAAIASAGLLSVEAVRTEIFRVVTQWFEKYTEVSFENDQSGNYTQPQINLEVEGMRLPTYLPEGYALSETMRTAAGIDTYYRNEDKDFILFNQNLVAEASSTLIDNEHGSIVEIKFNGYPAMYSESTTEEYNTTMLAWRDDIYIYWLVGQLDKDTIFAIAESVSDTE